MQDSLERRFDVVHFASNDDVSRIVRAQLGAGAYAASASTASCAATAMTHRTGPLALYQPLRPYFRGGPSRTGSAARYRAAVPDGGYGLRAGVLGWSPGHRSDLRGGRRAGDRVRVHAERKSPHQRHLREPADLAGLRSVERFPARTLRARSSPHFAADLPGGVRKLRGLAGPPVGRRSHCLPRRPDSGTCPWSRDGTRPPRTRFSFHNRWPRLWVSPRGIAYH